MKPNIMIRHAMIQDLSSITTIYNQAIQSKTATGDLSEFKEENRLSWFQNFDKNKNPIYVAVNKDQVIGYCTLSPYRPGRKAMGKVAEISFYINYSYHGLGIGSEMLSFVIADCKRIGKTSLLAILLDINESSIRLLKKFNFKKWGYFPEIIDLDGINCGQFVYGLNLEKD